MNSTASLEKMLIGWKQISIIAGYSYTPHNSYVKRHDATITKKINNNWQHFSW